MLIIVDEDRMPDGTHVGWHLLDTTDAAAHAALVALSGNAVGQQNAGWNRATAHPAALANETRWAFLKRQLAAAPANDPLKIANLV